MSVLLLVEIIRRKILSGNNLLEGASEGSWRVDRSSHSVVVTAAAAAATKAARIRSSLRHLKMKKMKKLRRSALASGSWEKKAY